MNHIDLLKRAFQITWRYRVLWVFGFFLALCGGGGGGGGSSNFGFPGGSGDFGDWSSLPSIDTNTIIALIVALACLVILLIVLGIVVRAITRTALMGMVRQIEETEAVALADGWRLGWSAGAWRVFLVNLIIGIPLAIVSILLILMALSPLLLLIGGDTARIVISIILTIFAVLFVILILFLINVVIAPFQEIVWRRTVLDQHGVIDSLSDAFGLIRRHIKDVVIVWLLMFAIGIGWGIVSLVVVLPVSLIAAVLLGGIPAGSVYLISRSVLGAAVAGIPLALLALIVVGSLAGGLFLVYQSTVWTLAYLEIQKTENKGQESEQPPTSDAQSISPDPVPET